MIKNYIFCDYNFIKFSKNYEINLLLAVVILPYKKVQKVRF